MVSERLERIRERINRREKKVRSKRRARSRRVKREEPEGARETATVKVRQAKAESSQSADEARQLAADAKTLVATELGISPGEAESVIEQASDLFGEAGSQIGSLDLDGDGDTDLLNGLDQPIDTESSNNRSGSGISAKGTGGNDSDGAGFDASEPIFDPMSDVGDASEPIFDPFADDE